MPGHPASSVHNTRHTRNESEGSSSFLSRWFSNDKSVSSKKRPTASLSSSPNGKHSTPRPPSLDLPSSHFRPQTQSYNSRSDEEDENEDAGSQEDYRTDSEGYDNYSRSGSQYSLDEPAFGEPDFRKDSYARREPYSHRRAESATTLGSSWPPSARSETSFVFRGQEHLGGLPMPAQRQARSDRLDDLSQLGRSAPATYHRSAQVTEPYILQTQERRSQRVSLQGSPPRRPASAADLERPYKLDNFLSGHAYNQIYRLLRNSQTLQTRAGSQEKAILEQTSQLVYQSLELLLEDVEAMANPDYPFSIDPSTLNSQRAAIVENFQQGCIDDFWRIFPSPAAKDPIARIKRRLLRVAGELSDHQDTGSRIENTVTLVKLNKNVRYEQLRLKLILYLLVQYQFQGQFKHPRDTICELFFQDVFKGILDWFEETDLEKLDHVTIEAVKEYFNSQNSSSSDFGLASRTSKLSPHPECHIHLPHVLRNNGINEAQKVFVRLPALLATARKLEERRKQVDCETNSGLQEAKDCMIWFLQETIINDEWNYRESQHASPTKRTSVFGRPLNLGAFAFTPLKRRGRLAWC